MPFTTIKQMFYLDMLSAIIICLVSLIGIVVCFFSKKYMRGDALYKTFFLNVFCLLISVIVMATADHVLLFLSSWLFCNLILTRLIIHKPSWQAALASGNIARRNFIMGSFFIGLGFFFLYKTTGSLSINTIIKDQTHSWYMVSGLLFLVLGAMTQSALWPFHRWLISSPNAPTPVSALMHAGIINGGGFLLARFAPLFFNNPTMLTVIFIVGLLSSLLGSLWKLMQHDIKRALACSTMGQMGFMFLQCGLGLFASALAHVCWHGMFKAYLFLSSGSAAQEKKVNLNHRFNPISFLLSLACATLGSFIFLIIHNQKQIHFDTSLFIVGIVFITTSQAALTILGNAYFKQLPLAIILTSSMAALYGVNVYYFDLMLSSLKLMQPQPLTIIHIVGFSMLACAWLFILLIRYSRHKEKLPNFLLHLYVKTLNSSQPHPKTITSYRKGYDYV